MVDDIRFVLLPRADDGRPEIVPLVGGESLVEMVDAFEVAAGMDPAGGAYGGLVPGSYRFGPFDQHFLGVGAESKTAVLGCDCGEWGCWPLLARISVGDDAVVWDQFEQPFRPKRDYSSFRALRFERRQYGAALESLAFEVAALAGPGVSSAGGRG